MKKLILFFALIAMAAISQGQTTEIKYSRDTWLLTNFNLAGIHGTDTSFVFKITKNPVNCWSIHTGWTGVSGSGTVSLEVTSYDDLTNWIAYTGPLSTTITGATGTDAWEDNMLAWNYVKVKITKGTLSAGRLKMKINLN